MPIDPTPTDADYAAAKEIMQQCEWDEIRLEVYAAIIAECMAPERSRTELMQVFINWLGAGYADLLKHLSPPSSETKGPGA